MERYNGWRGSFSGKWQLAGKPSMCFSATQTETQTQTIDNMAVQLFVVGERRECAKDERALSREHRDAMVDADAIL